MALINSWTKSSDPQVLGCVADTLLRLSHSPHFAVQLVQANVIQMLTRLSLSNPPEKTSTSIARTFANLVTEASARKEMSAHDTSQLLESLMDVVSRGPEAQLHIAKAVTELAVDNSGKALVVQSGWLEQLVVLAKSSSKPVRLHVALALLNLVQEDEIATKIMQEFGFPLFTSLADIHDLEVQRVVERCLEKLNTADGIEERISLDEYCVLPDDE